MIIKNSIVPKLASVFIDVYAITLWPFIFVRDEGNPITLNHENIHLKQQKELLLVGFYVLYTIFWLIGMVKYKNSHKAYVEIPFEREAYANQGDWVYILNRKRHSWTKYLSAS